MSDDPNRFLIEMWFFSKIIQLASLDVERVPENFKLQIRILWVEKTLAVNYN